MSRQWCPLALRLLIEWQRHRSRNSEACGLLLAAALSDALPQAIPLGQMLTLVSNDSSWSQEDTMTRCMPSSAAAASVQLVRVHEEWLR
jgi:hypothetical protein